jgi:hypothetical protein
MKDSTVFIGNLDPSSIVALGTPALVEAKSRELIALFDDTRRFILNAGCAIPATAPEANIRVVVSGQPRSASRPPGRFLHARRAPGSAKICNAIGRPKRIFDRGTCSGPLHSFHVVPRAPSKKAPG